MGAVGSAAAGAAADGALFWEEETERDTVDSFCNAMLRALIYANKPHIAAPRGKGAREPPPPDTALSTPMSPRAAC